MPGFHEYYDVLSDGLGFLIILTGLNMFLLMIPVFLVQGKYASSKLDLYFFPLVMLLMGVAIEAGVWLGIHQGLQATIKVAGSARPWVAASGFVLAAICAELYLFGNAIRWLRSVSRNEVQLRSWLEERNEKEGRKKIGLLLRVSFQFRYSWMPFVLSTIQLGVVIFATVYRNRPNSEAKELALLSIGLIGVVLGLSMPRILGMLNPSEGIAAHSMGHFVKDWTLQTRAPFGVSRWRTRSHFDGWYATKHLLRSLNGLRNKVPDKVFVQMDETYRKIAHQIRMESISLNEGESSRGYGDKCAALLGLVVNSNLVETHKAAAKLVTDDDAALCRPVSRFSKVLVKLDGLIQRHSRVLIVALGFALVIALLATGKFGEVLSFAREVIFQSGGK